MYVNNHRFVFVEDLYRSGKMTRVEYSILSQYFDLYNTYPRFNIKTDLTGSLISYPCTLVCISHVSKTTPIKINLFLIS